MTIEIVKQAFEQARKENVSGDAAVTISALEIGVPQRDFISAVDTLREQGFTNAIWIRDAAGDILATCDLIKS